MTDRWISVKSRLPTANTTVSVWCGWQDVATYKPKNPRRKIVAAGGWYVEPAGVNPMFGVTHWTPLMKPPVVKVKEGK